MPVGDPAAQYVKGLPADIAFPDLISGGLNLFCHK